MKASNLFLILILGATGALACNKSKSGGGGGSVPLAITELGITAQVPEGSKAEKAMIGAGVTIQGPDLVVGVEPGSNERPKTIAAAKDKASLYSPTSMKEESLPDGWLLAFQNKGAMGTNYWVQSRREIGGRAVWCDTTASSPEQQANAIAVCKSLSK